MSGDLERKEVQPQWKNIVLARPNKRYRRKVASPKQWAAIRAEKIEGACCRVCRLFWDEPLDPHHIIPRDRGGADVADNIAPLCRRCHQLVENRDPDACLALIESTWQDQPEPGDRGGAKDEYSYCCEVAGDDWPERIYGVRYTRPSA